MDSLRQVAHPEIAPLPPCCRCSSSHGHWDQLAGKPYCPRCEEALVLGESEPLVERTEKKPCAVCNRLGTICFLTYPLQPADAVEIDLCPEHFRALLGRRLGPFAYHQLRRQLVAHGLEMNEVFLLHDAFYDSCGRALQPIVEVDE